MSISDTLRASMVRKLRAMADRLEAGDDPGATFWADTGDGCVGWIDGPVTVDDARATAEVGLGHHRQAAGRDGWAEPSEVEGISWGLLVTVEAARVSTRRRAPHWHDHDVLVDYALVDPDTYAPPEPGPAEPCDCGACPPEGGP